MPSDRDVFSRVQPPRRLLGAWRSPGAPLVTSPSDLEVGKQVRVVGRVATTARPERTTWTHREAAFFQARVESPEPYLDTQSEGGVDETVWQWETRLSLTTEVPFWLTSDGGVRVLVLPSPWTGTLPEENVSEHPLVNQLTPAFEALMQRARIRSSLFLGLSDRARFHEILVPVGASLSVAGEVTTATLAPHGYRFGVETVLALRGTGTAPLVLSLA